ncbi:MAG: response regulator transcription factor [Steroidobacteraceae bacterium]
MNSLVNRVLVVEDEAHLAQGLRFNLEAEGYEVTVCDNGEQALTLLHSGSVVDVVVLDVMLPGQDGFAVVSALRQASNFVPVLMLTALHRPEDVLKGFESGADDYLPKPFDLNILLARIRSLLRRRAWVGDTPAPAKDDTELASFEFDGKVVDFRALELHAASNTFKLTLMEVDLLRYLIRHQGTPVSRQQILKDVWNLPADMDTRAIDNFIVRLRKYIEVEPSKPQHLLTVRGVGYKFVAE